MLIEVAILTSLALAGGSFMTLRFLQGGTGRNQGDASNSHPAALPSDLVDLKHSLSRLRYEEGLENLAEQALAQFQQSLEAMQVLQRALGEKFEAGEVTYARYEGAGREVSGRVLENLRSVRIALETWKSGRNEATDDRWKSLTHRNASNRDLTDAEKDELRGLNERVEARKGALESVRGLLSSNERALTELDRVTSAIREIGTSKSHGSSADTESLIQELEALAQQAKRYSS